MRRILRLAAPLVLALDLASGQALAMGGGSSDSAKPADPDYAAASQLVEDGKYAEAIPLLERVVAKDAKNADALNYLGYSNRQLGNNDAALTHPHAAPALRAEERRVGQECVRPCRSRRSPYHP